MPFCANRSILHARLPSLTDCMSFALSSGSMILMGAMKSTHVTRGLCYGCESPKRETLKALNVIAGIDTQIKCFAAPRLFMIMATSMSMLGQGEKRYLHECSEHLEGRCQSTLVPDRQMALAHNPRTTLLVSRKNLKGVIRHQKNPGAFYQVGKIQNSKSSDDRSHPTKTPRDFTVGRTGVRPSR